MTISKVLILIIGQNNTNPKLLQPIVTSICKVMAVKKPCVDILPSLLKIFKEQNFVNMYAKDPSIQIFLEKKINLSSYSARF